MFLKKKIVVFNAPISAGKDAVVDALVDMFKEKSKKMEMKSRLIAITLVIYGVTKEWWDENYTREGKELPRPELNGRSMREALIHTSETVIKPNFGQDYFGVAARQEIDSLDAQWYLFADGGFPAELVPIGEGQSPLLIRIHRKGYEYDPAKDSRSYIKDSDLPSNWKVEDLHNVDGEFDNFVNDVISVLKLHFSE